MATGTNDPSLYEVWHDVSHDPEELEQAILSGAGGTRLIAPTMTQFLTEGLVEPPFNP